MKPLSSIPTDLRFDNIYQLELGTLTNVIVVIHDQRVVIEIVSQLFAGLCIQITKSGKYIKSLRKGQLETDINETCLTQLYNAGTHFRAQALVPALRCQHDHRR